MIFRYVVKMDSRWYCFHQNSVNSGVLLKTSSSVIGAKWFEHEEEAQHIAREMIAAGYNAVVECLDKAKDD